MADPVPSAQRPPPPRWVLPALLVPIGVIVVATNYGLARSADLATSHPLLLLALNPRTGVALLVVGKLGAFEFYAVGLARLLAADPLFFLLGHFYGDRVLARAERSGGRSVVIVRRIFAKARWPLVVVAPNSYVCLLSGATGMSVPTFFALNIAGSIGRLYLLRALGERFETSIDEARAWLFDHRWQVLVVIVLGIAASVVVKAIRGQGNALTELRDLAQELEAEQPPATTPAVDA